MNRGSQSFRPASAYLIDRAEVRLLKAVAPIIMGRMAICGTSPINSQLRNQIASLQAQLDQTLNLYKTQRSSASLVAALKIQAQIVSALLSATALASPTSTAQFGKINSL